MLHKNLFFNNLSKYYFYIYKGHAYSKQNVDDWPKASNEAPPLPGRVAKKGEKNRQAPLSFAKTAD